MLEEIAQLRDDRNLDGVYRILDTIRDGIYALNEAGEIVWINETAVEEFDLGYTREELLGSHVSILLSDEDIQKCVELIGELVADEGRSSARCDVMLQTKHETAIPVELHLSVLQSETGDFNGTVGVVRDITDRRQREQRLMVLTRLLRHNLRNTVNVVVGRLELLSESVDQDAEEHVSEIYKAVEELTELSSKALKLQQTLAGGDSQRDLVDAVDVAERVCEDVRIRYPSATITLDTIETAPIRMGKALSIVVENLIENAVKHSDREEPTVEVTVGRRETDADEDNVAIRVADDGPGIPATEVQPLVNGAETQLQHGSGLGLWLVKWGIEGCGGELEFKERSPRGTVVTCLLPPADAAHF